jgi:CBS domain-containing protein
LICIKDRVLPQAHKSVLASQNFVLDWISMTDRYISDMVRHQNPLTLLPTVTAREACQCMRDHRVGAVLVTDVDHRLVGIFTGRDAVCRVLAEGRNFATTTLAEVMTRDPDTMPPGRTAIEALRLMQDGGYRHLPVIDKGKVVGVVSRGDFRGLEQARLDEETGLWERL